MGTQTISLYIGLLILLLINVIMGSVTALFEKRFDVKRLMRGLSKGLIITICFSGTYLVGMINPDIIAFNINGTDVDLQTALHIVILTSYYHYAKQVIEKLMAIINENLDEDSEY